jgi:peptide/nickel transport system substrate-binding protein
MAVALMLCLAACGRPDRPPGTIVMASGADLESGNPLVTVHPLSRQLQRHALFVTLVKLDSALQPEPYLARSWHWDPSRRAGKTQEATGSAIVNPASCSS